MGARQRAALLGRRAASASFEAHKPIAIVLVGGAPAVSFWLSTVERTWLVVLVLILQLSIAVATWALGQSRVAAIEAERVQARGETLLALTDGLEPVLLELARVSALSRPERRAERSGLVVTVLNAANVLGDAGSRPRASYFRMNDGTPRTLEHEKSSGRSVEAKARFVAGSPAGDAAIAMVDAGESLHVYDLEERQPPGWEPSQRGEYKTFISVAARAGDTTYGMLTVDAVTVGALTVEDVKVMRVLGHLVGTIEELTH